MPIGTDEKQRQRAIARSADRTVEQPRGGGTGAASSGRSGRRWVVIASDMPNSHQSIAVYPVTRTGDWLAGTEKWSVTLGEHDEDDPRVEQTPAETEVMAVWPKQRSSDYLPFIVRDGSEVEPVLETQLFDYNPESGELDASVTVFPAVFDGERWVVHLMPRLSWATPQVNSRFGTCGPENGI